MPSPLIGFHAFLGEFAVFAFFWVFVELFNKNITNTKRIQTIAGIGVALLLLSWIVGGFYYTTIYGPTVKPVILAGPQPWAHDVFTETKEHVFLLLPFLGSMVFLMLRFVGDGLARDAKSRRAIQLLALLVVLIGLSMAGMGYMISTGARAALEAGV
jgi:predicted RND superfamily exporter protein